LLQRLPRLPPGGRARCPRCAEVLATAPSDPIDRPLALALAAAICLIVANATPLMGISVVGRTADTTILGGALTMCSQGQALTGALVAICAAVAPGIYILFMLAVLSAARRPPAPAWAGTLLRLAGHAQLWAMPEVMLLGILVALVKIAELASVDAGIGLYAAGALPVLLAGLAVSFDPGAVWERVVWADGEPPR
jgi:paraquat-inducible protein A